MDSPPTQPLPPYVPPPPYAPPAPGPADSFLIMRMGREEGPYTYPDLHAQVAANYVRYDTLVRQPGSGWFRASEIPGLYSDKEC